MLPDITLSWNPVRREGPGDPFAITSPSQLPQTGAPLVFTATGSLRCSADTSYIYRIHGLQPLPDVSPVAAGSGLQASAGIHFQMDSEYQASLSLDPSDPARLRLQLWRCEGKQTSFNAQASISTTAQMATPDQLLDALESQAKALLPDQATRAGELALLLPPLSQLRDRLAAKAAEALTKTYTARLAIAALRTSADTALLDASFAFTEAGLQAYRSALSGDWTQVITASPAEVIFYRATLTHQIHRELTIDVHLPFTRPGSTKTTLEAIAQLQVSCDGSGRLFAYTAEATETIARIQNQSTLALSAFLNNRAAANFRIAYSHHCSLPASQALIALEPILQAYVFPVQALESLRDKSASSMPLDITLTLEAPGACTIEWLRTPPSSPAWTQVSFAVQAALRRWLPLVYFSDTQRYHDLGAAFPLLVYQFTKPYFSWNRSGLTYDVMNPAHRAAALRSALPGLQNTLPALSAWLVSEGHAKTARFYQPDQAASILQTVQRQDAQFQSLLLADAFFVRALVKLGQSGNELRQSFASDPAKAVKQLAQFSRQFVETFHAKLTRLYGTGEFLAFGSLLLVEATRALNSGKNWPYPAAALRLRPSGLSSEEIYQNPKVSSDMYS